MCSPRTVSFDRTPVGAFSQPRALSGWRSVAPTITVTRAHSVGVALGRCQPSHPEPGGMPCGRDFSTGLLGVDHQPGLTSQLRPPRLR